MTDQKNNQDIALAQYRKKQEFLHKLKRKYSSLLEFDKKKRYEWILTNFAKKKILFQVCNISNDEIKEIPSIYRYRCYLYEIDEEELLNLNMIFDSHMEAIKYENDKEIKKILLESLTETRKMQMVQLLHSEKTQRIPVMLDLRTYGNEPTMPIIFGDKVFELDEITREKIKASFDRVNMSSHKGQRFGQMLNHSKVLRDSYQKEINDKNKIPDVQLCVRVLQKATSNK